MNYFQEYEKLRKENSLITPGSIWKDYLGEVEIINVTGTRVYYKVYPNIDYSSACYPLKLFKRNFHRVF